MNKHTHKENTKQQFAYEFIKDKIIKGDLQTTYIDE